MSILIETEEDIARAKLFNQSLNAVWREALNGRCTPALLNHKTVEPGRFEYVHIGWSKETERTEQKAIESLEKLSAEDGLRKGGGEGYGYWLGVPYDACQDFHHDKSRASSAQNLDEAVKILRATIWRIETELDPDFPPIGELYFQLARCYYEHKRFEDHDIAYEKGLSFRLQNLETRPGYFGYDLANNLKRFAHSYLERDQLTQALGIYARLKQARSVVPKAVAAVMHEDFNLLAEFYERHGQVDQAAACYRSIGEQIDWTEGPDYEQQKLIREATSSLMRLKKYTDAEHLYEQLLDWGVTKNRFETESGRCCHDSLCGHWFEPYFQLLLDQNRLQHRAQLFEKLGMDEAQYLPPKSEALIGYVDPEGQWKIPQRFEDAENFSNGKAKVLVCESEAPHARARVIDISGNVIGLNDGSWDGKMGEFFSGLWNRHDYPVPAGYKQVERFNEGMTPVVRIEKKSTAYLGGDSTWEIGFATKLLH
ncbi:hypothetical protein BH10CYA1_BH10CYA1_64230 [soil metagenome]